MFSVSFIHIDIKWGKLFQRHHWDVTKERNDSTYIFMKLTWNEGKLVYFYHFSELLPIPSWLEMSVNLCVKPGWRTSRANQLLGWSVRGESYQKLLHAVPVKHGGRRKGRWVEHGGKGRSGASQAPSSEEEGKRTGCCMSHPANFWASGWPFKNRK